jgi:L-rhamnose mutarotase
MQRACFLLRVKPERLPDYLQAHQVWPEMLAAMHAAGVRNYSMFFCPDGLLVGYLEGEDIAASLAELAETEVSKRWQEQMAPFFETGAAEWLHEYFYLP